MILLSRTFWKCLFSPRLYVIYRQGTEADLYEPQGLERISQKIISTTNTLLNIGMYTSPLICLYIYRRGMLATDSLTTFISSVGCIVLISYLIRAYYRAKDPSYVRFLQTLKDKERTSSLEHIRKYDFDFYAWPVSYQMPPTTSSSSLASPFKKSANENLSPYVQVIFQLLAYIAVNTFALRLIYPGTLDLIHTLLWSNIIEGRSSLVLQHKGNRTKIVTADRNAIDTMLVDNRDLQTNGQTLVVCCEGNSGFYELGIMTIPIKAGYSVLGWNHPGFASSTGLPYPSQEHNAIDAVMQYAIDVLDYQPEQIIMFGWSIGGYTAAWAASQYPVGGLILDATFDDILPLAKNQMPASWSLLVKEVIRSHVDLDVAKLVRQYDGPVHIVRRSNDEIISLTPGDVSTNRGNYLAVDLIKYRHQSKLNVAEDFESVLLKYANMLAKRRPAVGSNRTETTVLKLLNQYTSDFKSTHCATLSVEHFERAVEYMTSVAQFHHDDKI